MNKKLLVLLSLMSLGLMATDAGDSFCHEVVEGESVTRAGDIITVKPIGAFAFFKINIAKIAQRCSFKTDLSYDEKLGFMLSIMIESTEERKNNVTIQIPLAMMFCIGAISFKLSCYSDEYGTCDWYVRLDDGEPRILAVVQNELLGRCLISLNRISSDAAVFEGRLCRKVVVKLPDDVTVALRLFVPEQDELSHGLDIEGYPVDGGCMVILNDTQFGHKESLLILKSYSPCLGRSVVAVSGKDNAGTYMSPFFCFDPSGNTVGTLLIFDCSKSNWHVAGSQIPVASSARLKLFGDLYVEIELEKEVVGAKGIDKK